MIGKGGIPWCGLCYCGSFDAQIEFLNAYRYAAGLASAKFHHLDALPYSLARCRKEPELFRRVVMEFDAGDHDTQHRVNHEFLSPRMPSLRAHMLAAARGEAIHPQLEIELKSIENIPLAEHEAEGIHRDVSAEKSRARGARLPWLASSTRLELNLASYAVRCRAREARSLFASEWRSYARAAQTNPSVQWRPAKMERSKVFFQDTATTTTTKT